MKRRLYHPFNKCISWSSVLIGGNKGNLSVVATVFDKLNQVYKEYLDAEQAYTAVSIFHVCMCDSGVHRKCYFCKNGLFFLSPQAMESGPSRSSTSYKRPVRTQAVIDQSDMYTHVLSDFTEKKVNEDCISFQKAIVHFSFSSIGLKNLSLKES